MYFFMSLVAAIVIYVITFKHEYTSEEFVKTTPFLLILGLITLLLGL
jgi:uncharacterized membrane protein